MAEAKVTVTIFGANKPAFSGGWGCGSGSAGGGPVKTMKDDAVELGVSLKEKYGDKIGFAFVDVTTSEIDNYPGVKNILSKVRLPLTAINGGPRLHGGLDQNRIEELIASLLV